MTAPGMAALRPANDIDAPDDHPTVPGGAPLDALAFAERLDALGPELARAARRLSWSQADADDLLQEAVLRAWTFRRSFTPGTNFRAWMHRILRNAGISRIRRHQREREALDRHRVEHALGAELPRADAIPELDDALSDEVLQALAALRPPFAETVHLVDVEGLSYEQAAARLGCPVGTVMSRLHRARRQLRRQLADAPTARAA